MVFDQPAARAGDGFVGKRLGQILQPLRLDDHVGVHGGDELVAGVCKCRVAPRCESLIGFMADYAHRVLRSDFQRAIRGTVVDDEQFVGRTRLLSSAWIVGSMYAATL
jgi:hypothetical protein